MKINNESRFRGCNFKGFKEYETDVEKPSGIDRDSANMREGNAPFADSALH